MNSDRATFGDRTWSTQTVKDPMYACSAGECSNSSEIRETTGGPVNLSVSLFLDRGDQGLRRAIKTQAAIKVKGTSC
jgi:hypothetical protein